MRGALALALPFAGMLRRWKGRDGRPAGAGQPGSLSWRRVDQIVLVAAFQSGTVFHFPCSAILPFRS